MKRVAGSVLALVAIFAVGCGSSGGGSSSSGSSGTTSSGGTTTGGSTSGTTTGTSTSTTTTTGSSGGDPTIIATNLTEPADLAVDSTSIYWTSNPNGGTGSVQKVALSGGTPTTIVSSTNYPTALALDSSNIYWLSGDGSSGAATLNKAGLDGSNATVLVTGQSPDQDTRLVVINGMAYWGDGDGIHSASTSAAGSATTVAPIMGGGPLLAADSTGLYWREINMTTYGYDLKHSGLDGSNVVTLGSTDNTHPLEGFTEDGTNAYWLTQESSGTTLHSVAITGGTPTDVVTYADDASEVCADSAGIYFADQSGSDNGVYKVTGGSTTLVHGDGAMSTSSQNERMIRLDASNVYWIGGGFNANQAVLHKMAR